MCECAAEEVPVAEVDCGEEDWSSLVPLFKLGPVVGPGRVVAADGFEALRGRQLVEADGVDEVLAVAPELGSGEGWGGGAPMDVGEEELGVASGGVAASGPAEIDGVHEASGGGVGEGTREGSGGSAEGLVSDGEGVHGYSGR